MESLVNKLQAAIDASGADMGVSLSHIESGAEINLNADASYPMASVLKIPVLCEAFHQMAAGAFTLADRWELTYPDKNIGSGILTYLQDGLNPTVRDLLTLMIRPYSDLIFHSCRRQYANHVLPVVKIKSE